MPAALAEARKNLENPPRIYTEIAIEQIDGNISFFKKDVPAAFTDVTDTALSPTSRRPTTPSSPRSATTRRC